MTTPLLCILFACLTVWLPKGLSSYEQSKLGFLATIGLFVLPYFS